MSSEFVKWDDLDLDYFFGDSDWTDNEDVFGPESEWGGSGNESDQQESCLVETGSSGLNLKENDATRKSSSSKQQKTTSKKFYKCPECEKQYASTSGFRGHVMKKHGKSDLKGKFVKIERACFRILHPRITSPV